MRINKSERALVRDESVQGAEELGVEISHRVFIQMEKQLVIFLITHGGVICRSMFVGGIREDCIVWKFFFRS